MLSICLLNKKQSNFFDKNLTYLRFLNITIGAVAAALFILSFMPLPPSVTFLTGDVLRYLSLTIFVSALVDAIVLFTKSHRRPPHKDISFHIPPPSDYPSKIKPIPGPIPDAASQRGRVDARADASAVDQRSIAHSFDEPDADNFIQSEHEVEAIYQRARQYDRGDGVEKDLTKAAELYAKAAHKGHGIATFNLYVCYRDGEGVTKDDARAFELLQICHSVFGDIEAMFELACWYQDEGPFQDIPRAIELYNHASLKGHAAATHNLAHCYQDGYGVPKNEQRAEELFAHAQALGYRAET